MVTTTPTLIIIVVLGVLIAILVGCCLFGRQSHRALPSVHLQQSTTTSEPIYFVSGAVRQLLAADGKGQLHTVHAGVKLFEKNPTKNDIFDFRLRQEGVSFVLPHMTKRVLRLDIVDFEVLLTQRCMLFANLKSSINKNRVYLFHQAKN